MSREPKKKPGDMAEARKRHLARQALSDKLKAIRESVAEYQTVWHTVRDRDKTVRIRITKFDPDLFEPPGDVLVRFGNRLAVVHAPDKMSTGGGSLYVNDFWIAGHVPFKNVLAVVIESYDRERSE